MNLIKTAWSIGSSVPSLLASPYGILIRLGLIAAVGLGLFGWGYLKGYQHESAAFSTFVAQVKMDTARAKAIDDVAKAKSDALTQRKDKDHEEALKDSDAYWSAELAKLQQRPRGNTAGQPVREPAKICNDEAGNNRLSLALGQFESGLSNAVGEFQEGVARLLAACEVQTVDLVNLQKWVINEQLIHNVPK